MKGKLFESLGILRGAYEDIGLPAISNKQAIVPVLGTMFFNPLCINGLRVNGKGGWFGKKGTTE